MLATGPTGNHSFRKDGFILIKELKRTEKLICHSLLARETVLGSSKHPSIIYCGCRANGARFAMKELRIIVANLIRNFELIIVPGQSHRLRVFTVPQFVQGYYHVEIKPRA
jgi:hypothetical protein